MTDALHIISTPMDERAYGRWSVRNGARPGDESYSLHCLVTETFGRKSPIRPFRAIRHRDGSRTLLGYSRLDADALKNTARRNANDMRMSALSVDRLKSGEVPELGSGLSLDFNLLTLPQRRMRDGGEIDAYDLHRRRATEKCDPLLSREDVYIAWLAEKVERSWGAYLLGIRVVSARRRPQTRRAGERTLPATATEFDGTLRVEDPARFRNMLAEGVGRHRSYGYGMILIRPARRADR